MTYTDRKSKPLVICLFSQCETILTSLSRRINFADNGVHVTSERGWWCQGSGSCSQSPLVFVTNKKSLFPFFHLWAKQKQTFLFIRRSLRAGFDSLEWKQDNRSCNLFSFIEKNHHGAISWSISRGELGLCSSAKRGQQCWMMDELTALTV